MINIIVNLENIVKLMKCIDVQGKEERNAI